MKYRLLLAYDGTCYSGWQIQDNGVSIQETLQKALFILFKEQISVVASGRTDAGVHAKGQVAHFEVDKEIDCYRISYALNALLPKDIRVLSLERAIESFHARYGAVSKVYHYHLHLDPVICPFTRRYRYHVPFPISKEKILEGTKYFIGTHDFSSFSNEAHKGSCARDPVRTLYRLDLCEEEGGIRLEFEGDGFLYKMVRNIVGTLLDVGRGRILPEEIPMIFEKDRSAAPAAAPPQGLFLISVNY